MLTEPASVHVKKKLLFIVLSWYKPLNVLYGNMSTDGLCVNMGERDIQPWGMCVSFLFSGASEKTDLGAAVKESLFQ